MKDLIKTAIEQIEADGWVYLIGSDGDKSGLFKVMPDGSQAQLMYGCNIYPSFLSDRLESIWKVEDGWLYFRVKSALYRERDDPDDPYCEPDSYVDYISYKMKIDGTELTENYRNRASIGTYSQP